MSFSSFFLYKMSFNGARKRISYLCEDGIEKYVPLDQRLSSLDKPLDADL